MQSSGLVQEDKDQLANALVQDMLLNFENGDFVFDKLQAKSKITKS